MLYYCFFNVVIIIVIVVIIIIIIVIIGIVGFIAFAWWKSSTCWWTWGKSFLRRNHRHDTFTNKNTRKLTEFDGRTVGYGRPRSQGFSPPRRRSRPSSPRRRKVLATRLGYGPCFFPLQFMAKHEVHELKWKKQGAVSYSTDQENEVSKMFIIPLGHWIELANTPRSQVIRSLKYGPLNQPITAHVIPERYNEMIHIWEIKVAEHSFRAVSGVV